MHCWSLLALPCALLLLSATCTAEVPTGYFTAAAPDAAARAAQDDGSDFTCPLDMFQVLPAINIQGPLPCAESQCQDRSGKVALITGGSTGIGRGAADRLVQAGMQVVATSRSPEDFTQDCPTGTYDQPGDRCKPVGFDLWQLDQTDQGSVDALIKKVADKYGHIDLLFLNAGRMVGANGEPIFVPKKTDWGTTLSYKGCGMLGSMMLDMDTNYWGALRVWQAVLPLMPTSGYSRVIISSSVNSAVVAPGFPAYSATKRSLDALAEEWMGEHYPDAPSQVTVLYPGNIRTDVKRDAIMSCPTPMEDIQKIEAGSYSGSTPVMSAVEAGEAVYRIAMDPQPPMRVLMAHPDAVPFHLKRICRHWTLPMERWVPVGWQSAKAHE